MTGPDADGPGGGADRPFLRRRRRPRLPFRWPASRWRRALLVLAGGGALLLVVLGILYATVPDGSEYRRAWPERTAYMELRVRQAREAGRHLELRYHPVPLDRIPASVQRAVRVAEDAGFYAHGAFDWAELRAALRQAWREEEAPRGASTITQQLARNLYLSPRRSVWRKLREALIAVRMEHALSKRRIFELYLNVIELGPGIFGVEAASEHYFGVPVDGVGPGQAVRLAATIPSPLSDNPDTGTREFRWRVGLVGGRAFPPESAAADTLRPLPAGSLAFPGPDSPAAGGEKRGPEGLPSPDTVGGGGGTRTPRSDTSGSGAPGADTSAPVTPAGGAAPPDTSGRA